MSITDFLGGDDVLKSLDVTPLRFHDGKLGEAVYVYPDTNHWARGWILRKTRSGEWVTVRKATAEDVNSLSSAVIRAHHSMLKEAKGGTQ